MITVTGNDSNKFYYKCDCGAKGFFIVKPTNNDATLVVDIKCPLCSDTDRLVLLQYSSEKSKEKILKDSNECDLTWTPIIDNDLVT